MRVKVYEDLYPGPETGWACATCVDNEYEDGGPIDARNEDEAISAAHSRFPDADEIIVGEPRIDDTPARRW